MEYLNEEELRTEIINIQQSQKMKKLKADYELYLQEPVINGHYAKNMEEYNALASEGYVENYSRETYGQMILKLVERMCLKSSYIGYTYRDDFYSNAIQRVLSYSITNFDPNMISKRSGQRVKAFAYLTSIINNAILEIINDRNEEQEEIMEHIVPMEELYYEIGRQYRPQLYKHEETKEEAEVLLKVIDGKVISKEEEICAFETVFDTLKDYPKDSKIKLEYPMEYRMSLEEADKISALGFDYLNLSRIEKERYKPQFPKRAIKEKEDLFEGWE